MSMHGKICIGQRWIGYVLWIIIIFTDLAKAFDTTLLTKWRTVNLCSASLVHYSYMYMYFNHRISYRLFAAIGPPKLCVQFVLVFPRAKTWSIIIVPRLVKWPSRLFISFMTSTRRGRGQAQAGACERRGKGSSPMWTSTQKIKIRD